MPSFQVGWVLEVVSSQKWAYVSDKGLVMTNLNEQILERARSLPEGTPLRAKELLHLGTRVALDQSLSRLVKSGQLLRVGRGLYVSPVETRFGNRSPSVSKVVEALGVARGETLVSSGAAAANALGLTTQVPVRMMYLTSGRTRLLSVGSQTVELRHAPRWQLELPEGRAGQALRALAWIGQERASEVLRLLRRKLSSTEIQALTAVQGRLPTWVAKHVSSLAYA